MLNVDVGFADPFTEDVAELRRRAEKPGRAAAAYVYAKQQRYPAWRNPTEDLVPFIIEGFGHPSKKAVNFLRQFAPTDPRARSLELRRAYRELSERESASLVWWGLHIATGVLLVEWSVLIAVAS